MSNQVAYASAQALSFHDPCLSLRGNQLTRGRAMTQLLLGIKKRVFRAALFVPLWEVQMQQSLFGAPVTRNPLTLIPKKKAQLVFFVPPVVGG